MQKATDEELMQMSAMGNRRAFEMLYDRYFDKLVWFARGYLTDNQKAEDAVQDIFIKLIDRPEMFDQSRRFSTWIYTVAGNMCKNIIRDEQNRLRLLEENGIGRADQHEMIRDRLDQEIIKQRLDIAYTTLNEKEKSIYTLRFKEELSIKEIAEVINIPEGSVKSGIYYMLKKLAAHLKDLSHGS